jgi:hypothetical protein
MRLSFIMLALVGLALPAQAQLKASFIKGTYVFAPGACDKLKALAAGGVQSVETVPWYVTADGISYWEGGCGFSKIEPGQKKREWLVTAECGEGADESTSTESYSFVGRTPTSFFVTLTTPGASEKDREPVIYRRCDVGPIPPPE